MTYSVTHTGYCGMTYSHETHDDRSDARRHVAEILAKYRGRAPIAVLERGQEYEICEPENAAMIPDWAGYVRLAHVTYECHECGFACETRDDARACCAEFN
jgi:hypothetical protein